MMKQKIAYWFFDHPWKFYVWAATIYLVVVLLLLFYPKKHPQQFIDKMEVWTFVESQAIRKKLNPEFVYSIILAESSLNAYANSGYARGMMQLSQPAWKTVRNLPYDRAYDWRENVTAGIDYLHYLRQFLERHEKFSYRRLAAAYRYGPNHLKRRKFSMKKMPKPKNDIYKILFAGEVLPAPK